MVLGKVYREDVKTTQMEHWSILSDMVKYVQHDKDPNTFQDLSTKALDYRNHKKLYDRLKREKRQMKDIDFASSQDRLKRKYLDMYEGIHAEVIHLTKFDEYSDLSTIYLGKTGMTRETKIKAEERFSISGQGYMVGKLLDNTECQYC